MQTTYPDGIRSNFVFRGDALARPLWRYPDLTRHVGYVADVLARTICDEMREESQYLRSHAQARTAIKEIMEMPDPQIDRVIRSVEANKGALTNVLAREMPMLTEPGIWDAIVQAVRRSGMIS